MRIVSFVVRLECEYCHGTGKVPAQEFLGESPACPGCGGFGTREGVVLFEDFAKLIKGTVDATNIPVSLADRVRRNR